MALEVQSNNADAIIRVTATGRLIAEDFDTFIPEIDRLVEERGKIRILFQLKEFHGWTPGAAWEDMKFGLTHTAGIERLAMVGDARWEKGLAALFRPFTRAEIRYFDQGNVADARAWLAS